MWRRNAIGFGDKTQDNQDSDQSISEEEEGLDSEWTGNTISLGGGENKGAALHVLSQLEILRESRELQSTEKEPFASHGKKAGYHIVDEVEIPVFDDEDSLCHYHRVDSAIPHSNNEMIYLPAVASISYSHDEKLKLPVLKSARENSGVIWSEVSHEMEALVRPNGKSSNPSHHDVFVNQRKSSNGEGGRGKAKHKFVFPSHSHEKHLSLVVSDSSGSTSSDDIPLAVETAADEDKDDYEAESQLNFHDEVSELIEKHVVPFELAHNYNMRGHSMVESLNCFLEKNNRHGSSEVEIQKKIRSIHDIRGHPMVEFSNCFSERSNQQVSPEMDSLDDVCIDDDALPEILDRGSHFQNKGDEEIDQSAKAVIPRTMADQFHEAFETASKIDDGLHLASPRPLCELYKRLQQVVQSEKERDMDSLRKESPGMSFMDEGMTILVRILSKSLEGNLIVCSCSCVGKEEKSYWEENLKSTERSRTIIFNPRMCADVDLEVGNFISIQPPWKEVQVKDEVVFLCSNFCPAEQGIVAFDPNSMNSSIHSPF